MMRPAFFLAGFLALVACGVDGAPEPKSPEPEPRPESGFSVSGSVGMGVKR